MTKHLFSENSIYKKCCLLLFALTLSLTLHAQKEVEKIKTYLRANATQYQLTAKDINEMAISSAYLSPTTGWYHVYFNQTYQSVEVYNGLLNATLVNDNVAHIGNSFVAGIATRVPGDSLGILLSPVTALARAAQSLSLAHNPVNNRELSVIRLANGQISKAVYTNADLSDENIEIKLYWLPYNNSEGKKDIPKIKLSWDVRIMTKDHKNAWSVQVDAVSGEVLMTSDKIVRCDFGGRAHTHLPNETSAYEHGKNAKESHLAQPLAPNSYNVFDYPLESPNHGSRTIVTNPYTKFTVFGTGPGNTNGWHTDGSTNYTNTRGNNVWAKEDRNADDEWNIGQSPDSPTLDFNYSYTQGPNTSAANQNAAITNLFYWNNLIHDVLWKYGFDETAGNFQQNNMSRGGNGNDYVFADAQDGSGSDNANFYTPSDGSNPRMQMFLWSTGGNPQYQPDSDFDNAVIAHEYGHGWSIRLTGGPANVDCLWNDEQGGEGWSDYLGLMLTTDWSLLTPTLTSANIPRGIGTYVLTEPTSGDGIRPYRYSYDMANINSPVTYGKVATYAVPHGIGSIWATMLWDMTWEIIMQDNRIISNVYNTTELVGNVAAFKLVNEGLRLQPCSPSFIDARNAILKADSLLFNSRYKCAIWKAFARRGLGVNASTGGSSNDTYVVEDFTPSTDRALSSPLSVTICSNSPLVYTATTSTPGTTTYNWTRAVVAGISNPAASGNNANINETLINTTGNPIVVIYRFFLTPSDCPGAQDVRVTVNPSPLPTVSAYDVCQNGVVPDGEGLVVPSTIGTNTAPVVLTTGSPTYNRGAGNQTTVYTASSVGTAVYYQTITFVSPVNGSVTVRTTQSTVGDPYLSLYQNSFNPASPATNFLMGDDDSGGGLSSMVVYNLIAGNTYVLVGATFSNGYTGSYILEASSNIFGGLTQWFTSSSGGSAIATGSVFNPVGVPGSGIYDTSNPGATTFYAASSSFSTCRTPTTFTVNPYTVGGNLAGSATVCGNHNSGTLTLSGHIGSVIRWESSTNNFNDITIINDTTASLTYTNLPQTTQFRVVVKSGACSEQNSSVATITILPGDAPTVTGASRCDTGTVLLTATGCASGTVNWYTAVSGGSVINTGTSYTTPVLSTTTTYYVSCSVSSCAVGRIPVTATIISSAAPATSGGSSCGNGVVTLTATGCANGTINWYAGISGGSSIATGTSYTTPILSTTTTYYVSCTINACTSVRASAIATITQRPNNPTTTGAGRCGAGSVNLTATGCANGTINWYSTLSGGSSIATGTSFATPGLSTTTTYYVNCTVNNCVSIGRSAVTATIISSLAAPSGTGGSRCGTGSVNLTAVGCAGGGTLSWFTGMSGGTVAGTGESYATPAISTTTTYYAACVLSSCSSVRVPVVATVNPAPSAPVPSNANRCGPGIATLSATGCAGGDIYWYTASSGGFAIAVGSSYSTAGLTSSVTYYISCVVGPCASERVPVTATVNPVPAAPATANNSRCGTGSVTLTASGCVGGTINWYSDNSGGSSIASGTSFNTPSIASTTTYYAGCTVGVCTSGRVSAIATVNPAAIAPTPGNGSRCGSGSVSLTATGCAGGTINWYSTNSGGSAISTGTSYVTPGLSVPTTTYYISCTLGSCTSDRVAVVASINAIPAAPAATDISRCGAGSVSLLASGCTGGVISWHTASTGGSLLTTGTAYNTGNISATTTYYISCTKGLCTSDRVPVQAIINTNLTYATGNQAAGTYRASQSITSASDISTGTNYFAGQAIMLMPGFHAGGNEVFAAQIQGCAQGN